MRPPSDPGPTESERALAYVSTQMWDDYKTRFRPAEKALAKKAEFTTGERAQVKGAVAADTAAAFKGLARSTVASGATAGADVASGKTKMTLAADAEAQGRAKGLGQAMAATGGEQNSMAQKLQLAGFGRGIATGVVSDMSRGAVRATNLALAAADAKFQRNQQNISAGAAVAGAATRKFGVPILNKYRDQKRLRNADMLIDEFDLSAFGNDPFKSFSMESYMHPSGSDI